MLKFTYLPTNAIFEKNLGGGWVFQNLSEWVMANAYVGLQCGWVG